MFHVDAFGGFRLGEAHEFFTVPAQPACNYDVQFFSDRLYSK